MPCQGEARRALRVVGKRGHGRQVGGGVRGGPQSDQHGGVGVGAGGKLSQGEVRGQDGWRAECWALGPVGSRSNAAAWMEFAPAHALWTCRGGAARPGQPPAPSTPRQAASQPREAPCRPAASNVPATGNRGEGIGRVPRTRPARPWGKTDGQVVGRWRESPRLAVGRVESVVREKRPLAR
jgi:hypothetical protein